VEGGTVEARYKGQFARGVAQALRRRSNC
jgi:hypothetical protein